VVINRRILIPLAVVVVVCFAIAIPVGNKHHGLLGAIGNITWYAGLLGLVLLIVLAVVALVQSRRSRAT
jgi:TRAP-type C4-dicarboxylate transport system permease small subunit